VDAQMMLRSLGCRFRSQTRSLTLGRRLRDRKTRWERANIEAEEDLVLEVKGRLAESDESSGLQIVCLEGYTGSGTNAVCDRLEKAGYQVRRTPYLETCLQNSFARPDGPLVANVWAATFIRNIVQLSEDFNRAPETFRDRVAFVDRSLLSPGIYAKVRGRPSESDIYFESLRELQQAFVAPVVFCKPSDLYPVNLRIKHRLERAEGAVMYIRLALGEADEAFREALMAEYESVETNTNFFDATVDSSDTRYGVLSLMKLLKIKPGLFPWDKVLSPEVL